MNLTTWVGNIIGNRYKLIEQRICGDGVSNLLHIQQIYSVPRFRNKEKVVSDFRKLNGSSEFQDGLLVKAIPSGWAKADCSLYGVNVYILPNGGKIQYFERMEKEPEIVHCKDCRLRKLEECAMQYECDCGEQHSWENDNDYCSWGIKAGEK